MSRLAPTRLTPPRHRLLQALGLCLAAGAVYVGCASDPKQPSGASSPDGPDASDASDASNAPGDFLSDDPEQGGYEWGSAGTGGDDGSGGAPSDTPPEDQGANAPSDAIERAHAFQTAGNRFYSFVSGLAVVDGAAPDQTRLLGRYRTHDLSRGMYLRGNIVYGLTFRRDIDRFTTHYDYSSRLLALDVSDPAAIRQVGEIRVPGEVTDSYVIGDVLYLVSQENGACTDCGAQPRTTITSFDISDAAGAVKAVGHLAFEDPTQGAGSAPRHTVSVSEQRLYVAIPGADPTSTSDIQVVDISAGTGTMRLGASLHGLGSISQRWQMNESGGVLRVLARAYPSATLSTFTVASADSVTPLAALELQLPADALQGARFDGAHAFAYSSSATANLVPLDLTDPAAPKQAGAVTVPGEVLHIDPRGNRLYVRHEVGTEPRLHVSTFDVSDVQSPALLVDAPFEGRTLGWSQSTLQFAEPEGLLFVPFLDSSDRALKLFDWTKDSLEPRGTLPYGAVFQKQQRWLSLGTSALTSFDLSDRDNPRATADLQLTRPIESTIATGEYLVRRVAASNALDLSLEIVRKNAGDSFTPEGTLAIPVQGAENGYLRLGSMHADGSMIYFEHQARVHGTGSPEAPRVSVVDLSDPKAPRLVAQDALPMPMTETALAASAVIDSGSAEVFVGKSLIRRHLDASETVMEGLAGAGAVAAVGDRHVTIDVVDFSSPTTPSTSTLEWDDAFGQTGLIAHQGKLYSSHYEPAADGRVRFYLDRIDVTDPAHPTVEKTNIPGSLLGIDPDTGLLLTMTYTRHQEPATYEECHTEHGYANFAAGSCEWFSYTLNLVDASGVVELKSSLPLEGNRPPSEVAIGHGVAYVRFGTRYAPDHVVRGWKVDLVSGFSTGKLESRELDLNGLDLTGALSIVPNGRYAMISADDYSSVLDVTTPGSPRLGPQLHLGFPEDVAYDDQQFYVSLGEEGVATVPLQVE
ncbi:MAG: beta-propeller domain-containing protein [Myxococcales bacterium]|nr:beta-propeller domain-containing protein [Myxococcales bacterium]